MPTTTSKPLRSLYPTSPSQTGATTTAVRAPAPAPVSPAGVGGTVGGVPTSAPQGQLPSIGGAIGVTQQDLFQAPVRADDLAGFTTTQSNLARKRDTLGNLGPLLANPGEPVTGRGAFGMEFDTAAIQASLNFDTLMLAEMDRQKSYNLLNQTLSGIGQDPQSTLARQIAERRLRDPGNHGTLTALAKARSAAGLRGAQRDQRQSLAARGFGGGPTAFQSSALSQAAGRGLSQDLQSAELARYGAEGEALSTVGNLASQDEARRMAVIAQINDLLGSGRGGFDLSAFAFQKPEAPDKGFFSQILGGLL